MPSWDRPTASEQIYLERDGEGWEKNHKYTHTHKHTPQTPIELKTYTHPLSRGSVIFASGRVKAEEKTGKLRRRRGGTGEVSDCWERVANAGDRGSLVTRRAWRKRITAFPYYIHNATGNFLSPVWLRDPLPLLILLPPTIDGLKEDGLQATILHAPSARVPLSTRFITDLSVLFLSCTLIGFRIFKDIRKVRSSFLPPLDTESCWIKLQFNEAHLSFFSLFQSKND